MCIQHTRYCTRRKDEEEASCSPRAPKDASLLHIMLYQVASFTIACTAACMYQVPGTQLRAIQHYCRNKTKARGSFFLHGVRGGDKGAKAGREESLAGFSLVWVRGGGHT